MSTSRRIAWNTLVQIGGKFLVITFGLLILKIITQQLGTELTGKYLTALNYAQLFSTISELGLYAYLVRDLNKSDSKAAEFFSEVFSLRLLTGFLFLLLTLGVLPFLPYDSAFQFVLGLAIISGFFTLLNATFIGVFQAKLRMELTVATDVLGRALTFAGVFLLIPYTQSLSTIFLITIGATLINFFLNGLFIKKVFKLPITWKRGAWSSILKQTLPIWITAMLSLVYFKVDSLMLSVVPLPGGKNNFVEVGYYGTVYKYLEILITFPAMFLGSIFPVMSQFALSDTDRFKMYLQRSFDVLAVLSVPILVATFVLAPSFIEFLSSAEFLPAAPALRILIFAFLAAGFGGVFTYAILSLQKQKSLIWPYAIATIINIIANYIAIRLFSFIGAAYITVITEALIAVMAYVIVVRTIQFTPNLTLFIKSLLAAAIMGSALYALRDTTLFFLVPLGAVLYFIALYLIGGIDQSMIASLTTKTSKEPA